jgi:hypothetical protein
LIATQPATSSAVSRNQTVDLGSGGLDYIVIRQQVPVRKGKWRMVSKEVEEADNEE